jgi:hypothetical protein
VCFLCVCSVSSDETISYQDCAIELVTDESVRTSGGMIMTNENQSTWRRTCLSATSSTTNLTQTGLWWNPGLRGERPPIKRLSHGTHHSYATYPILTSELRITRLIPCSTPVLCHITTKQSASYRFTLYSTQILLKGPPATVWEPLGPKMFYKSPPPLV